MEDQPELGRRPVPVTLIGCVTKEPASRLQTPSQSGSTGFVRPMDTDRRTGSVTTGNGSLDVAPDTQWDTVGASVSDITSMHRAVTVCHGFGYESRHPDAPP